MVLSLKLHSGTMYIHAGPPLSLPSLTAGDRRPELSWDGPSDWHFRGGGLQAATIQGMSAGAGLGQVFRGLGSGIYPPRCHQLSEAARGQMQSRRGRACLGHVFAFF